MHVGVRKINMWLHTIKMECLDYKRCLCSNRTSKNYIAKETRGVHGNLEKPEQLKHPGEWRRLILNHNVHA